MIQEAVPQWSLRILIKSQMKKYVWIGSMSVIVKAISMLFIEYYRPKEIELDKISRYPAYEEYAPHGEEKKER